MLRSHPHTSHTLLSNTLYTSKSPTSRRSNARFLARASDRSSSSMTTILDAAMKEPITFFGGVFAGFLDLDVQQDPLRTWIDTRAAEAGLKYASAKQALQQQQQRTASGQTNGSSASSML